MEGLKSLDGEVLAHPPNLPFSLQSVEDVTISSQQDTQ